MPDFNNSTKAIYLQIADAICDSVISGELKADERVPSVREYAAAVEVNVNTVMRAYDHLAGQGVIYNKRGLGFFAAADAREKVTAIRRREVLDEGMESVFRQLALLDVTPAQLADMYSNFINNQSKQQ